MIWDDGWSFCPLMQKLQCLVIFLSLYLNITGSILLVFFISSNPFNKFQVPIYISVHFFSDFLMRSILVSLAEWYTVLNSTTLWRSLKNNMKSRGPRTDPCGTSHFNSLLYDCVLLILVNCILSLRNERNQLLSLQVLLRLFYQIKIKAAL